MLAVFDVVVEENDLQRTVDERRLLHRVWWVDWVSRRLFSTRSICLISHNGADGRRDRKDRFLGTRDSQRPRLKVRTGACRNLYIFSIGRVSDRGTARPRGVG